MVTRAQALGFERTVVQVPRQHQATASEPDTYCPGAAFPVGSLLDLLVHDSPSSSISNSLLVNDGRDATDDRSRSLQYEHPSEAPPFSSITRMLACSRVLGFCQDSIMSYARIARTAGTPVGSSESLVDGGANICVTGNIALLSDVISIPPLPISVALHGESTMDDCCTARGWLPIQLDDGLVFWQQCYYSKNAVETIISPQAIVNSSNVFCSWQQTGYRDGDGTPGSIHFDSHDGCVSMQMTLQMKDGILLSDRYLYCSRRSGYLVLSSGSLACYVIRRRCFPSGPPTSMPF